VTRSWGPDGRIAYSSLLGGLYQICVVTPGGKPEQVTMDGSNHEEPVWAPDGRHIAYCRTSGRQSSVYILDTLGDPEIRLTPMSGNWYSPAWSDR
jgi:TolB protein